MSLLAQIGNPVLQPGYGQAGDGVGALTNYIVLLWRTLITVGGMAALVFLLWGALDWILAGGEDGKVAEARKKMTGAVVGLAILAGSVAIVELVGILLNINLLRFEFPSPNSVNAPN